MITTTFVDGVLRLSSGLRRERSTFYVRGASFTRAQSHMPSATLTCARCVLRRLVHSSLWRLARRQREEPQLDAHVFDIDHFRTVINLPGRHWAKK